MIRIIAKHELRQILHKSRVWYGAAFLQVLLSVMFNWLMRNFLRSQAITDVMHFGITEEVIHPFYAWLALLVLLFIPAITAQCMCGERQRGTMINYYCAPVSGMQVMAGKFLAINMLLLMLLMLVSIMPLCIVISGTLDWGQLLAAILGVYLMLCAAIAFAMALSAFTTNTLRTNCLIFVALAMFILMEWAAQYAGPDALFLQNFGLLKPLKAFLAGIINVRATAYYALIILGSLILGSFGYARGRTTNV